MKHKDIIKTIIVDIVPPGISADDMDHRMTELESLVTTYGGITIVKRVQKRQTPDYRTFMGSGKLDEIMQIGEELCAELLIVGNIMKPAQIWNINEYFRKKDVNMQAWDRIDLILKIFSLHAVSPESKLQIELAAIKHMGPRIFGMGMELSRQGGGSKNAKGQGETNTEIMKRHLKEKEKNIIEKLKTYKKTRSLHRSARKRKGLKTVGIVGYTNAGKSSLFNVLTNKGVLAEDKLFATLGTSVGKTYIADDAGIGMEVLLNDTIGFIRDLPPELISAFISTLEDSIESDLLLHVIDASDMFVKEKIEIVHNTLYKIGSTQDIIYVFNKVDMLSSEQQRIMHEQFQNIDPVYISAHNNTGIEVLKKRIHSYFIQ